MNASGLGLTHSPRYTAGLWGLTLLGGWAALWYYQWLFRTRAAESGNLVSAAFLGFLPIALVLVVSVAIKRARFAPVAVVALAIVFS